MMKLAAILAATAAAYRFADPDSKGLKRPSVDGQMVVSAEGDAEFKKETPVPQPSNSGTDSVARVFHKSDKGKGCGSITKATGCRSITTARDCHHAATVKQTDSADLAKGNQNGNARCYVGYKFVFCNINIASQCNPGAFGDRVPVKAEAKEVCECTGR